MAINYDDLDALFQQTNLAENLEEEQLAKIGATVLADFEQDLSSRQEWDKCHEEWMKLAIQTKEPKTYPWFGAANVKYPLVSTAAMQFHARSYPTIVSGGNIVKAKVCGYDPTGEKANRADRIAKHMSYQVLEQQKHWDEDMDKLLFSLPIEGTAFKKVYYDSDKGHNVSELVFPKDLVVNYWAKDLETALTKTHVLYMTKNSVKEKQLNGVFLEVDIKQMFPKEMDWSQKTKEKEGLATPSDNLNAPLTILEQHRWLDLDEDGYDEPYIVTVEYSSGKVLRISPRFEKDGVVVDDGKILKITPEEYFVKYTFIPNPDGGFYGLGFGALLGPMNETVNTLINQLLDSGAMSTLSAGFIAKGVRIKGGDQMFQPGEWKVVQTSGDDLKKGIFPLPTKEPSSTLFNLLGSMVESGQQMASVADIFVGKMPGQNTPATTTMATIEQGMKVFTAIYKRIYRDLTKEFKRLYRLNKLYMPPEEEFRVLDSQELMRIGVSDYQMDDSDIKPAADPTAVSEVLKLTKAQALGELIPLGTLNVMEVTKRILEAQDQPEIEKLLNQGPPPPDPKMMEAQVKMQVEQQKAALKQQEMQLKLQFESEKNQMEISMKQLEMQLKEMEMQLKAKEAQMNAQIKAVSAQQDMVLQHRQGQMDMQMQEQNMQLQQRQHQQAIEQSDVSHQQKLKQAKESSQAKTKDQGGKKKETK